MARPRLKRRLRVVFVSERRADYSRFKPILALMRRDPFFDYRLIVTGVSLLKEHGRDIKIIRQDGFRIEAVIPMFHEYGDDTGAEMTRGISRVMSGLADCFERIKPDLIFTGFDIGANFAAAVVGAHMNIPVAHIQGGEVSGSIDESLRHAISKFAHIHFPATKDAAGRLRRMGENPKYIFPVGCTSIDALLGAPRMSRAKVLELLKLGKDHVYLLVVQHPVTTESSETARQFREIIAALKTVGHPAVILYPNNDAGSRAIKDGIRNSHIRFFRSFSPDIFANVLRYSSALIGNSSTGIHETATFHIPTVNVGSRQQYRERNSNVIDVTNNRQDIARGITKALTDKRFRALVTRARNIYGDGHAAARVVKILKKIDYSKLSIQKHFID